MSRAVKSVSGALGMGPTSQSVTAANINKTPFMIEEEAKKQRERIDPILQAQLASQQRTQQAFTQADIANTLAQQAQGRGPSLAEAQLKSAQERNLAQLVAAQAAARGSGGGASMRNLAQAQSGAGRAIAQDAAAARLQEQKMAQQQLQQMQAQEQAGALDLINQGFLADTAAKREIQQAELSQFSANQQAAYQANEARAKRNQQVLGGVMQTGAALISDKNAKTDMKNESKKIDKFLETLAAKSYEYKDSKNGKGKKFGIMAQDMEKSEVGRTIVKQTKDGKAVDMKSALSAVLAAQARLNERMKKIEKK